jgi:alkyl hydroperoxide reductase subunit D
MSDGGSQVESLLANLPDACKDLRLNLQTILRGTSVDAATTLSAAVSSAYFCRRPDLAVAIRTDAGASLTDDDVADAQAAAALMGMTTVYYRTRHLLEKETYKAMRPSLRMNRMMSPASRTKYEACALSCAALGGCEDCLKSHEANLLKHGLSEENVHDLVRIASVINGVCIALATANS